MQKRTEAPPLKPREFITEVWLPGRLTDIFAFFADARNLEVLTPGWLKFRILTPGPIEMRTGALIRYRLKLRGIPISWLTEITAWEPPHRFVDEQRRGPYRLWIHEHRFQEKDDGTLMTDSLRYAVPGGILVDRLFVRRDVERIFAFREARMRELFGRTSQGPD